MTVVWKMSGAGRIPAMHSDNKLRRVCKTFLMLAEAQKSVGPAMG